MKIVRGGQIEGQKRRAWFIIIANYMPMAYNKSPPSRGEWGRAARTSILSLTSMRGVRDFGSQIYKEIITVQIFKQKIWHMTTLERMSVILLEYIREFGIRNSISLFHEVIIRNDAESVTSQ